MNNAAKEIPILNDKDKTRFWSKIKKSGANECWEWQSTLSKSGYGTISVKRRLLRAHRVSLSLNKEGFDKDKPHALHSCDNPKCCNPLHLFWGSHSENMKDMALKKRATKLKGELHSSRTRIECRPRGAPHKYSKFTESQVLDIRHKVAQKLRSRKQLALDYGVSVSAITAIHKRQNWFHI